MTGFNPKFTITNRMTSAITQIERARGFVGAMTWNCDTTMTGAVTFISTDLI